MHPPEGAVPVREPLPWVRESDNSLALVCLFLVLSHRFFPVGARIAEEFLEISFQDTSPPLNSDQIEHCTSAGTAEPHQEAHAEVWSCFAEPKSWSVRFSSPAHFLLVLPGLCSPRQ